MAKPRTTQEAKDHPTLHERMIAVSHKASYVHRDAAPEKDGKVIYTAATFDAIVAKLRPVLVENGVLAYPDHDSFDAKPTGTNGQYAGLFVRVGIRFVNADDPSDFFVVPGCAIGTANKYSPEEQLAGRLQTYAYKAALRYALLLETGDDPDFEAARAGAEVPPEIQERIDRVMDLALTKHEGDNEATDAYVRNVLDAIAKQYSRPRILSLSGLQAGQLDDWLKKLQQKTDVPPAPRGNGAKKTAPAAAPPTDVEVAAATPAQAQERADEAREELERRQAEEAAANEQKCREHPVEKRVPLIITWLSNRRPSIPQSNIRNAFGGWMFHARHRGLADDATWVTVWGQREEILADLDEREKTRAKA